MLDENGAILCNTTTNFLTSRSLHKTYALRRILPKKPKIAAQKLTLICVGSPFFCMSSEGHLSKSNSGPPLICHHHSAKKHDHMVGCFVYQNANKNCQYRFPKAHVRSYCYITSRSAERTQSRHLSMRPQSLFFAGSRKARQASIRLAKFLLEDYSGVPCGCSIGGPFPHLLLLGLPELTVRTAGLRGNNTR